MFADAVTIDPMTQWAGAITALAVTIGLISQIVLQVLAKIEAAKKAKVDAEVARQAKADAEKAQNAAASAALEALKAKTQVAEVAQTLSDTHSATSDKLDDLAKVTDTIHTLTNNAMGVQLRLNADLSRWKANETKDPADVRAADLAAMLLNEHNAKQATADSGGGK
jgi:acyl-CoA reductase-like NAD-dependent aldehyde dehydrogenase